MKTNYKGKNEIREELAILWQRNVHMILNIANFRHEELGKMVGVKRQTINTMLNRDDHHLTGIQFLGTMQGLKRMIEVWSADERLKNLVLDLYEEIDNNYKEKGLK